LPAGIGNIVGQGGGNTYNVSGGDIDGSLFAGSGDDAIRRCELDRKSLDSEDGDAVTGGVKTWEAGDSGALSGRTTAAAIAAKPATRASRSR